MHYFTPLDSFLPHCTFRGSQWFLLFPLIISPFVVLKCLYALSNSWVPFSSFHLPSLPCVWPQVFLICIFRRWINSLIRILFSVNCLLIFPLLCLHRSDPHKNQEGFRQFFMLYIQTLLFTFFSVSFYFTFLFLVWLQFVPHLCSKKCFRKLQMPYSQVLTTMISVRFPMFSFSLPFLTTNFSVSTLTARILLGVGSWWLLSLVFYTVYPHEGNFMRVSAVESLPSWEDLSESQSEVSPPDHRCTLL